MHTFLDNKRRTTSLPVRVSRQFTKTQLGHQQTLLGLSPSLSLNLAWRWSCRRSGSCWEWCDNLLITFCNSVVFLAICPALMYFLVVSRSPVFSGKGLRHDLAEQGIHFDPFRRSFEILVGHLLCLLRCRLGEFKLTLVKKYKSHQKLHMLRQIGGLER